MDGFSRNEINELETQNENTLHFQIFKSSNFQIKQVIFKFSNHQFFKLNRHRRIVKLNKPFSNHQIFKLTRPFSNFQIFKLVKHKLPATIFLLFPYGMKDAMVGHGSAGTRAREVKLSVGIAHITCI